MGRKASFCVDSSIAMVIAALVAAVVVLFSFHVRADEPTAKCQDIAMIQERAKMVGMPVGNWRAVKPDKMEIVNDIYEAMTGHRADPAWDTAELVDTPKDDGILFVGRGGQLCQGAAFDAQHWRALVKTLEGEGI